MSTRKDQLLRRAAGKKGRNVAVTREEKALRDALEKMGGGSGGGSVQPDLSQNDPTAADYVKNRTHYEGLMEIDIIPEQEVTFVDGGAVPPDFNDDVFGLVGYGNTVKATLEINGEVIEGELSYYIVVKGTFGAYQTVDDQIFLEEGAKVQDGETVTVRMYIEAVAVKELDYKYLPKNLTEDEQLRLRSAIGAASYDDIAGAIAGAMEESY